MRTTIVNIGTLLTGRVRQPRIDADSVSVEDGRIVGVGSAADADNSDIVIDAAGATVLPGLIDSHVHLAFGDYTPRQQTVGYLESYVHGGVTTVISASEVHVPGRPRTPEGLVALAVAAHHSFENYRPGGMRAHGGSIILDPSLSPEHLATARRQGVWLAKAGFGAVDTPFDYAPLIKAARDVGMITTLHTGGSSIPSSLPVTGEHVVALDPHISFHCNGGPVAMADADYDLVLSESSCKLQFCTAGNTRTMLSVARSVRESDDLERILLGTDTPSGSGIMPLGLWYTIASLASLADIEPDVAIAWATGNNAETYGLDTGVVEVGRRADLVIGDVALGGSRRDLLDGLRNGDVPGIGAVITDGIPRFIGRSRNTPPPSRAPKILVNNVAFDFSGTRA